jgi:hypothetical protein
MRTFVRAIWPRRRDRVALGASLLAGALVGAVLLLNGLLALLILEVLTWLDELEAGATVIPVMPLATGSRG